jgi:ribokinase
MVSEMAVEIQKKGIKSVIITLGSKGALYREGAKEERVPGIQVQPVDTTAAGDTFNGYLVVEMAKGKTLHEAITIANKAAAISVTRMGAQPSIPYFNEINLNSHF